MCPVLHARAIAERSRRLRESMDGEPEGGWPFHPDINGERLTTEIETEIFKAATRAVKEKDEDVTDHAARCS